MPFSLSAQRPTLNTVGFCLTAVFCWIFFCPPSYSSVLCAEVFDQCWALVRFSRSRHARVRQRNTTVKILYINIHSFQSVKKKTEKLPTGVKDGIRCFTDGMADVEMYENHQCLCFWFHSVEINEKRAAWSILNIHKKAGAEARCLTHSAVLVHEYAPWSAFTESTVPHSDRVVHLGFANPWNSSAFFQMACRMNVHVCDPNVPAIQNDKCDKALQGGTPGRQRKICILQIFCPKKKEKKSLLKTLPVSSATRTNGDKWMKHCGEIIYILSCL